MDARPITVTILALTVAACSSLYESSDFQAARERTVAATAAGETPEPAAGSVEATSVAAAPTPSPTPAAPASQQTVPADLQTATAPADLQTATAPAATEPAEDEKPRGFLAMFRTATEPAAETATAGAIASPTPTPTPAADGPIVVPQADAADLEIPVDATANDEAELAGEVEADPDEIAVPEESWDDGLEHDFVTVYSSKPEAEAPAFDGLPGVTWSGGVVYASRGGNDDPSNFFGGADHPFARTVPGVPRKVIQAANGLLLQHAAINVDCVKPQLLNLVRRAEGHFGKKVVVTSGYRSPSHNRRVRGAKHSQHMFCNALDLYMPGVARDDLARFFYAQSDRGGIGIYCSMKSIHIDIGKRRQWRWGCRRR